VTKTADEYNAAELAAGRLTNTHVTSLVRWFQNFKGLDADGKAGPTTRKMIDTITPKSTQTLEAELLAVSRVWPMRCLTNGRKPEITSGHYEENDDRSTHRGVDIFFRHLLGDDPKAKRGDGQGTGKDPDGTVKWWIPPGTTAIASAKGKVVMASWTSTGYRVWIDVGPCYDGYFHLETMTVAVGQLVEQGAALGLIGDNPSAFDASHLHFENYVGDLDRYMSSKEKSLNPRPFLQTALYLPALSAGGS
jgi:hypothetical protein